MDTAQFLYLLERYESGDATGAEEAALLAIFADPAGRDQVTDLLTRALAATPADEAADPARWQPIIDRILGHEHPPSRIIPVRTGWGRSGRWIAAASLLVLLSAATCWFFLRPGYEQPPQISQTQRFKNDIAPGGNRAILTLSNGQQIILDSAQNGILAQDNNTIIKKQGDDALAYLPPAPLPLGGRGKGGRGGTGEGGMFNTLTTPRGGQYQLRLPDGSKVWLNASSSITYPTAFSGKERLVEITGEAYFEIVHNTRMPFKVKAGNKIIEDIGTHFNINSYADEPATKISLLEGSVKILQGVTTNILKPGEQAAINNGSGITRINNNVDMEEVMAWKNGQFQFAGSDIHAVMRQIARWYRVDLDFAHPVTETFYVKTSRNTPLSTVLKILETTGGVHFTIDGKKISVSP